MPKVDRTPKEDRARAARAEQLFKNREERKADAPKAMAEYRAAEQALRDRTRTLRQIRLAREAGDLASQAESLAKKVRSRMGKRAAQL
jgi:hypothetical protein